jgi:hypothetical protein|tara:strand:+ start:850 stop:1080 length:231 start_codon:yes stop_codon:yes gene_type:complete
MKQTLKANAVFPETNLTARGKEGPRHPESFTGANRTEYNHSTHGTDNWRERHNNKPVLITRRAVTGTYANRMGYNV